MSAADPARKPVAPWIAPSTRRASPSSKPGATCRTPPKGRNSSRASRPESKQRDSRRQLAAGVPAVEQCRDIEPDVLLALPINDSGREPQESLGALDRARRAAQPLSFRYAPKAIAD